MPSPNVLEAFKEGIRILQAADDFATLRHTIDKMVSICPAHELPMAKDAIARVIRTKQAAELAAHQGYPQAIEELDKKYRDLYIVLRTAKSHVPVLRDETPPPAALPTGTPMNNQMARAKPLGGLNMPSMILDWLRSKRKYLIAGGAVGAVGGAYLLYKQLTSGEKAEPEKESNFDKTIKSIQKYKAFTQMMNDPNFSGDYNDLINGNYKKTKKKKELKKKEDVKSLEWDRDEKSLMKNMDEAFTSISTKPELDYQLPQLPAPKNIDPHDVIGDSKPIELSLGGETKKPEREKPKKRRVKKTRKPRKPKAKEEVSESTDSSTSAGGPTMPSSAEPKKRTRKSKKVKPENATSESPGRLIPIIKRTKRVRKVNA